MKRRTKILSLVAALILGQLLFVGPAGADHYPRHYFKSPTTGRCLLGGQLTSSGTGWVGTWPCEASWWLVWEWRGHFDTGVWARIKGVPERSCLDSNDRGGYGDVYMHRCVNSPNQLWKVYLNGGYAKIENLQTKFCLEEPFEGGAVQTHPCRNDTSKQWWRIVSHPAA